MTPKTTTTTTISLPASADNNTSAEADNDTAAVSAETVQISTSSRNLPRGHSFILGPQGPRPSDLPKLKGASQRSAVGPLTLRVQLICGKSLRDVSHGDDPEDIKEQDPFVRLWTTADPDGTNKKESIAESEAMSAAQMPRSQRTAFWGDDAIFELPIGQGVPVAGHKLLCEVCHRNKRADKQSVVRIIGTGSFSLADIRSQPNDEIITLYHRKPHRRGGAPATPSGNLRVSVQFKVTSSRVLRKSIAAAPAKGIEGEVVAASRKRWSTVAREGAGEFRDDLAIWKKLDDWMKRTGDKRDGVRSMVRFEVVTFYFCCEVWNL
jgi:hypothetical protein